MPFFTYMLRCNDVSYYVGHTDDLEKRIADHNSGGFSTYTRKGRPVTVVWSDEFQTREEALAREKQIQGWSRAKKEALIAGNWERLKLLSRSAGEVRRGAAQVRASASVNSASAGGTAAMLR